MDVVAIMLVRNEEAYLPRCLERLREQGIRAAVLDNESTDRTAEILASFQPDPVVHVARAPFAGTFGMTPLLQQAAAMQAHLRADWFILNSADEVFDSDVPGESLPDAIRRVDAQGFTAVNFDEFVFVPESEAVRYEQAPFDRAMMHYYYYAPTKLRQMRAWKNLPTISNVDDAGHRLRGEGIRLYPSNMPFRHFITLSLDHFRRKYGPRRFPADELARGWHHNRANIDITRVKLPPPGRLKRMNGTPSALDRSEPWVKHFWELGGA